MLCLQEGFKTYFTIFVRSGAVSITCALHQLKTCAIMWRDAAKVVLVFFIICLCYSSLVRASQRLPLVSTRSTPTVRMFIKPNGRKWGILGYSCNGQKCLRNCLQNNNNFINNDDKNSCTYNCSCSVLTFVTGLVPSTCKLTNRVECKNICIQGICKDLCHNKMVKVCENITG